MFPRSVTGSWEDPPGRFSTRWEEGCVSLLRWPLLRQVHAWVTYVFLFVWFSTINHACLSQAPPCSGPDTFLSHFKARRWALHHPALPGDSFYLPIDIGICRTHPWQVKVASPALPKGAKGKGLVRGEENRLCSASWKRIAIEKQKH